MKEETILKLKNISTPRVFQVQESICYEGEPGNEMYIILKGSVGIFLTNALGTLTQVATIQQGDFFGEMSIFDNLPRSASCIALEKTVAVAIDKNNLGDLLAACPDIANQMLENMSSRIRKLNDDLYKNNRFVKNRHLAKFAIPREYKLKRQVEPPQTNPKLIRDYMQACPICGKAIKIRDLKRNLLEPVSIDMDCRIHYSDCEPMWYDVISCPNCSYTNHYLKFFAIHNFEYEIIKDLVRFEHKKIVDAYKLNGGKYDNLVVKYLQAININEHINPGETMLIGNLWRNLYWLSRDLEDTDFADYCAKKAISNFKSAVDEYPVYDAANKGSTALSLASLLAYCGSTKDILHYINLAVDCPDAKIHNYALKIKERFEASAKK